MIFRNFKSFAYFINKSKYIKRFTFAKRKYSVFCLTSSVATKLSCDDRLKIQEPDSSKLTREYLIHSSSITTAENAVVLLTQTALALQHAETEYKEALLALVFLLELKLTVLGNAQEEARIWDIILEGRSLVASSKKKRDDLEILFSRCLALVNNAAEVSYMAGSDIVGDSIGERLNKLEKVTREVKLESEQAEQKLQETEVKAINVEGKFADEHADELELERQKVIQDLQSSNSEDKGVETQNKEGMEPQNKEGMEPQNKDNIDIRDIFDNDGNTLTDDAAKEI